MRKVKFSELNIENIENEEQFYERYLKNIKTKKIIGEESFQEPDKKYEIVYLDILGGKIILLEKRFINSNSLDKQMIFYDYSIAYKAFNIMMELKAVTDAEKHEKKDLYDEEKNNLRDEIRMLKKEDNIAFLEKEKEYNFIINSSIYKEYSNMKIAYQKLLNEYKELQSKMKDKEESNIYNNQLVIVQNEKNGFIRKFINKLKI